MTQDSDFATKEEDEFLIPQVPRDLVRNPPALGDDGEPLAGRLYAVQCPDVEGCGWFGDIEIAQGQFDPQGQCPDCRKDLMVDFSRTTNWGIGTRGAGYHSTAWGRRKKQDMIRRNRTLEKKQWDNVQPMSVVNPDRVQNATPGGPLDPNSKFNKHKNRTKKIIYPK